MKDFQSLKDFFNSYNEICNPEVKLTYSEEEAWSETAKEGLSVGVKHNANILIEIVPAEKGESAYRILTGDYTYDPDTGLDDVEYSLVTDVETPFEVLYRVLLIEADQEIHEQLLHFQEQSVLNSLKDFYSDSEECK